MEKIAINNSYIELHVPDFKKAKSFYRKLGFEVAWERKPEMKRGYLLMKKENNILCFFCGNNHVYEQSYFKRFSQKNKCGYATEIVIMVNNIDNYHRKVKKFAKIV